MGIGSAVLRHTMKWAYGAPALKGLRAAVRSLVTEGGTPLQSYLRGRAFADFTDLHGNTFPMIEGLRDRLKPYWRDTMRPRTDGIAIPDRHAIEQMLQGARTSVDTSLALLRAHGFHISGSEVLEFGCGNGSRSIALVERGAARVTASDLSRFYPRPYMSFNPNARDDEYETSSQDATREAMLRVGFGSEGLRSNRVEFVEDNISLSTLPSESFDLICSWEVMEHVYDPASAMKHIHRLLKPGGFVFTDYNPFFSLDGGHSPCTLDFFWGHVLLDDKDVRRYIREFRPNEYNLAVRFYEQEINRMSMAEFRRHSHEAGLEALCLMPWPRESHVAVLTEKTLKIARDRYPKVTAADMVSPVVWALSRKPPKQ